VHNVYNTDDEKIFGCSSLHAVISYITEIGVASVLSNKGICITLNNGEYIEVGFGCPTSAHDWIIKHVPGNLVKIVSRKEGSEYLYEKEY
jgi:hypothetical protein